eukprot:m.326335 g.326335  ORF g.326335 m.326335 type:complete len:376 (-) comp20402_c0_seq5:38-1165(-)
MKRKHNWTRQGLMKNVPSIVRSGAHELHEVIVQIVYAYRFLSFRTDVVCVTLIYWLLYLDIRLRRVGFWCCNRWIDGPPKKPMNSYLLFAQEQRQNIVKANPEMSVPEIVSHTATLWRRLTEEQKLPYVERARQDKQTFEEERTRWLVQSRDSRNPYSNKKLKGKRGQLALAEKRVKRVSPAYIFFSKENRKVVQAAQPEWKMCDVSKELGRLWRELGPEERKPYDALHEQDKERHRTEIAAITASAVTNTETPEGASGEDYRGSPGSHHHGDMEMPQHMMMSPHMFPGMIPSHHAYSGMHQQPMQAAAAYHQYATMTAMQGQYNAAMAGGMHGYPGDVQMMYAQPYMQPPRGYAHPPTMMRTSMGSSNPHTWAS